MGASWRTPARSLSWRYQRDTGAYTGVYFQPGNDVPGPGRQATPELLRERLAAAAGYRHVRAPPFGGEHR